MVLSLSSIHFSPRFAGFKPSAVIGGQGPVQLPLHVLGLRDLPTVKLLFTELPFLHKAFQQSVAEIKL